MLLAQQGAFMTKPYDSEVEFIQSSGTQYIDTGVVPKSTIGACISYELTDATQTDSCVLMDGGDNAGFRWGFSTRGGTVLQVSGINATGATWINYEQRLGRNYIEYNYYNDKCCYLNGKLIRDTIPYGDVERTSTIWINASYNAGVNSPWRVNYMRIFFLKIVDNGIVVRDMIPVRKDGAGYMYDRVTGRLFGNLGTGAFTYGADVTRVQSAVVQYVQNGLVAMWDGIENVGLGMHSNGATTWMDVSGHFYNGTLVANQLGTGYSWEDDAFVRKNMGTNGCWTPIDMSDMMLSSAKDATMSIEIVTGGPVGYDSWTSQIFNLCQSASDGFSTGITGLVRNEAGGGIHTFAGITYATTESFTVSPYHARAKASLVLDGSTIALYNGTTLVGNKTPAITADSTISAVFARLGSSNYAYRGRYMNYRIYDRALSASEVAANHAVDKMRFNLP